MIAYLSVIVLFVGLVMYFIATHPKVEETGRLMFFAGLLAFLISVGGHAVEVIGR